MKERREQLNQKTNPQMITSAKNCVKKKKQNHRKSKAILTKSQKEAYT